MEALVRVGGPAALPTLSPAVPPYVKLGLTVAYTVFYSLLFAFVYAQLWLVLRYRHKRLSYQTVFLFLCLLWAALRALLFSFYFRSLAAANALGPFTFWLLYCFPVCLQFFTLSLMNLYFAQVVFKAKSKYAPELVKYRLPLYLVFLLASLLFLVVNLTCALLVKMTDTEPETIVLVRVAINDTLFVLCAISLSLCLYKIAKMSLANIYLESKGTSVCQVTIIGAIVIFLYTSRACYNLVVLALSNVKTVNSFDYDWYNVSDQVPRASRSTAKPCFVKPILFKPYFRTISDSSVALCEKHVQALRRNIVGCPVWCDLPPGRLEGHSGGSGIRCVRGDPLRLGAAPHVPRGFLLQSAPAHAGQGEELQDLP
uniref:G protein-coupled receptor 137B n=1 Tax=Scleropages formosus TaxID=113540 RepID=A0A8C9TAG5_SCLFO